MTTARPPVFDLYIDESGSRHPDRPGAQTRRGDDWFTLGGIIIEREKQATAQQLLADFLAKWPQVRHPLHMTDMNSEHGPFAWIGRLDDDKRTRFWSDLRSFLALVPVAGTGCVIDRPGYKARGYGSREGDQKWLLCRSAFDILLDRTAKYAASVGRRLQVYYERADPVTDARVEGYFENLRENGLAFDASVSAKYRPLSKDEFAKVLIGIEGKPKSNRMMQIADCYVYSVSRGAYNRKFHVYRRLAESGKLITSQVPGDQAAILGIKTYWFDD